MLAMEKIIRTFGASAIRHFVAVASSLQVGSAASWIDPSLPNQLYMALIGSVVGPGLKALLDTAEVIEGDDDPKV